MPGLLPIGALAGVRVGISVSQSPDLARLGLLEGHLRLALAEVARCALVAGGEIAYGGHLAPDGYTAFLVKEVQKYGRRDRPLLVCLAWQEHRGLPLSALDRSQRALGQLARFVFLDQDGRVTSHTDGRGEEPQPVPDPDTRKRALTGLRRHMAAVTQARFLIGGKRHNFEGEISGLMEEALFALAAGHPLYLAGGFGGVTLDIAAALGVDDGAWLPASPGAPADDPRWLAGRAKLWALARDRAWTGLDNGLTDDENRRLAASHRPGEIASLVGLGLGRHARR